MQFVYKYWAKIGGLAAVFIIGRTLYLNDGGPWTVAEIAWINLALLLLHQFEEYVYPGGFREFFNTKIYNPKGIIKNKLTVNGVLCVNVLLAWPTYLFAAVDGNRILLVALAGIGFINALLHAGVALRYRMYNPGLVSALVLFIPFGLWLFMYVAGKGLLNGREWFIALAEMLAGTALVPLLIFITKRRQAT